MHPPGKDLQEKAVAIALLAMLPPIWLLLHGYHGLVSDAQLYAFQAIAKIHPHLAVDLYLQNTSQDQFTVFSPFYAFFIGLFGVETAARTLTVIFTVWLYAAAWSLARALTDRAMAFLAVAFLMIISGDYGGSGVFRLFENYLTARLPAEAMIITALAWHFRGARTGPWLLAVGALFVHPLIALPGLLLLFCLTFPLRVAAAAAAASVAAVLALAVAATRIPAVAHAIPVMDPDWLGIVRERSQFLFLPLWSLRDWSTNAQPFVSLLLTILIVQDPRLRKPCLAAALIGAAGLAVALIGGLIGPIAILLQGQAWRWVWVVVLIGGLLAPLTALKLWREGPGGPLCAVLLLCSWIASAVEAGACILLALLIWLARRHVRDRSGPFVRWNRLLRKAAYLLGAAVLIWVLVSSGRTVINVPAASIQRMFETLQVSSAFRIVMAILAGAFWWGIRSSGTIRQAAILSTALILTGAVLLPLGFTQRHYVASASDAREFSDWSSAIAPTSTVLVAPAQDVGTFVWFTLQRPNYLSLDQSAGVVFARATSMEVERRSQILLPLMDPDWKIFTRIQKARSGTAGTAVKRRLTAEILTRVCQDPLLGFVISPDKVGLGSIGHDHPGPWKGWQLYDCRDVRRPSAST